LQCWDGEQDQKIQPAHAPADDFLVAWNFEVGIAAVTIYFLRACENRLDASWMAFPVLVQCPRILSCGLAVGTSLEKSFDGATSTTLPIPFKKFFIAFVMMNHSLHQIYDISHKFANCVTRFYASKVSSNYI